MPVSFAFVKPDGSNETLDTVDKQIAEFCGEEPNKDVLSFMDNMSDIGCNILQRTDKAEVTIDMLGKYITYLMKHNMRLYTQICWHKNGKLMAALPKFLCNDYTFKAWR